MASAAWERRNARARALGYDSYYDYRAHGYGRRPASEPRARGPELAALRGHRADADFARRIARGDIELAASAQVVKDPKTGRFTRVTVDVVDAQGRTTRYRLKRLGPADRKALYTALTASGARVAGYLRALLSDVDTAQEADTIAAGRAA